MAIYSAKIRMELRIFRFLYKYLVRRSARHILQGRLIDPALPEKGRFMRREVDDMLAAIWTRVDELVPDAGFDKIPTTGNRNNVYMAVMTTAAYQALLESGQSKARAADLVADVGWKIYELGIALMSLPFRMTSRNQGKRIERTINALLVFPFNASGRPGYEVKVTAQADKMLTHWTWCPPQAFVRNLVETKGDHGELDAFYRSWCLYDWPGADIMAGDDKRGRYQRKKTLSRGDPVCDMCWRHKAP